MQTLRSYTVKQLAHLAGVSVRTLHHYDEIGLLRPAFTGTNRYRYYGEEELLRLQQILIHRAFGMPLAEIAAVLDAPDFDRLTTLKAQRTRLAEDVERQLAMIETIDRTIKRLEGEITMKDKDLYSGIVAPEKQAGYEAWLAERYGPDINREIERSHAKMAALSDADMAAWMEELREIENMLAEGLRRGVPPQSTVLDPALKRHRRWVGASQGGECGPHAYAELANIYQHPDFQARYEAIEPGFANYLVTAMKAWAGRQGR
ncbi:MerR family transcriptional regulator [Neorhizobium sp. R1-B]|uniref:MerR family transcriptional regulator n=1 Tax=Neorhizobium sp. R1-B TaxID=2485162 RepID=UPI001FDEAEAB|nr:MerR family transcriptional regulator [Neorhizobium sp. R1-B]